MRGLLKLLFLCAAAVIFFYLAKGGHENTSPNQTSPNPSALSSARQTWGNPASLPDHFARHGSDFRARTPEEYALFARQFLERAKAEGLPAKIDDRGVLRVFDARSDSFGSYNPDGTTKTFFKPGSPGYFERQPGRPVNLKTQR